MTQKTLINLLLGAKHRTIGTKFRNSAEDEKAEKCQKQIRLSQAQNHVYYQYLCKTTMMNSTNKHRLTIQT